MGDAPLLAVVGGGRWARVYVSVLAGMHLPYRLAVVARHGSQRMAGMKDSSGQAVAVLPDLDALLAAGRPAGAIVVNAAMRHADTAQRLLAAGVPVLVEKPAAPDEAAARTLQEAAQRSGSALMPALTYLHCAYLDNFARLVRAGEPRPANLRMAWTDPAVEVRHGENKGYDRGIGVALDVVPHVWSVLVALLGRVPVAVEGCGIARGGRRVDLRLRAGDTVCDVLIEREAAARRRCVEVGDSLSIDFSSEPGTIRSCGVEASADADWATRTDRPVRRQLDAFLRALAAPPSQQSLADLLDSARLAGACDALVKARQRELLAGTPMSLLDADTACAVRELLAPVLLRTGRLEAGDAAGLEAHVLALQARAAPPGPWLDALAKEGA